MVCKNCTKNFIKKYSEESNGEFCSKFCAHSYVSKQTNKLTKIIKCVNCGKNIEVSIRSSAKLTKCNDCKKQRKKYTYKNGKLIKKVCKICGQETCQREDICKKYRIFKNLIKYFGLDQSKIGTLEIYKEFDRIKNMLEEDYYDNMMSTLDMAEKYGHNHFGNFNKILDSIGIKKRNLSVALQNAIFKGKLQVKSDPIYKQGWYETWNRKKVFYRSSYELDYCKELDEMKIDYEVEKLRILYWDSQLQKQRVAIPDFYLTVTNEIVEIKSDWTYDEQNMKDKFMAYKEHGYKVKLILEHKEKILDNV